MTDKLKRKGTPRRRFGIRWLLLALIIVSGGIATYHLLQPEPERIIYFQHNDDGQTSLWLADLNRLEQARQISDTIFRTDMISVSENHIYYINHVEDEPIIRHWLYDIRNRNTREIFPCQIDANCYQATLSPDGEWLSYYKPDLTNTTSEQQIYDFVLYNIDTDEELHIAPVDTNNAFYSQILTQWITAEQVAFVRLATQDSLTYAHYDLYTETINDTFETTSRTDYPFFTTDGTVYIDTEAYRASAPDFPEDVTLAILSSQVSQTSFGFLESSSADPIEIYTASAFDYHLVTQKLIIHEHLQIYDGDTSTQETTLNLYNLNDAKTTLIDSRTHTITMARFNDDGTQILVSGRDSVTFEQFISIIDLETTEETILPIAGTHPQWVD
ncbi:MAG: hypothetical protein AAF846_17105 [Chloroflexota bacterium]